jgi:sugar lactone lactonase YvrE
MSNYNGGLFPVWITLKEPVENASSISWKIGKSRIAYRRQAIDEANLITADTAFLYWEEPPTPFIKIDSIEVGKDSLKTWKLDTTYYYRDTIFAIIDDYLKSFPIVIEIKNILPRITNLSIDGMSQPGDSILTIVAHTGGKMNIRLSLNKPFNNTFHPIVEMPKKMGELISKQESDSLYIWEWNVPRDTITDSSAYLRITDTGGYGERLYKIYLAVYTESGSIWVASEKELVKYSPSGAEVARIKDDFKLISDIAVNSNNERLYVADQQGNSFAIYDRYGKELYKNKDLFKSPSGIAVDVAGGIDYIWIADAKNDASSVFEANLRRFIYNGNELRHSSVDYDMSGPIKGLSIDQFKSNFVWFAIPKSDTVGFVSLEPEPTFILNDWNRPSMISHDPINGIAWIADSSRIVAVNSNGTVLANISGFSFVSSVSAGGGCVWAADIKKNKVYRFKGPFNGSKQDLALTAEFHGMAVGGFLEPIFVSTFNADGSAWVIDKGRGTATRLDSLGHIIAAATGLELPIMGKTLQKVE